MENISLKYSQYNFFENIMYTHLTAFLFFVLKNIPKIQIFYEFMNNFD